MGGLMTSRLRIKHRSAYQYTKPVTASYNEVRLTPTVTPWQIPLESTLRVEQATWQYRYIDYWGTQVRAFEVQRSHDALVVEVESLVETDASRHLQPLDVSWADLASVAVGDKQSEYLAHTAMAAPPAELADFAAELAAKYAPHEAALALSSHVHDAMNYRPGSTGVHTTAAEAWAERSGVCQDYVHLLLGGLRHIGMPARYVSGYLHPRKDAIVGETVTGESHAWVEWWSGEWVGHDPTNDIPIGERHVLVGRGRDYADVPPIKGIVAGAAEAELTVSVELVRLA
jgi:transglutaminase-like putative cysteine protease